MPLPFTLTQSNPEAARTEHAIARYIMLVEAGRVSPEILNEALRDVETALMRYFAVSGMPDQSHVWTESIRRGIEG